MADHDAHEDVQRDQRALAGLYALRAGIPARQRVADEELARIMRELDRARAAARSTTLELEAADAAIANQCALIQRRARILSPIHRMPSELLRQVFSDAVHPCDHGRCHPSFIIASICRRWRSIALLSPALWTSVHLDFIRRSANAKDYVEVVLARSGGRPLLVYVYANVHIARGRMIPLEDSLPEVIMRAHELHISHGDLREYAGRHMELSGSVFKFLQLPTPHMDQLHIQANPYLNLVADSLLPVAPLLQSLCLSGLAPLALQVDAFRNVRELELFVQPLTDLTALSAAAPRLQRMTLNVSLEMFPLPALTPSTFPCLGELRVGGLLILSCFTADSLPALERLIISPAVSGGTRNALPSMPSLRHLELRRSWFPSNFAPLIGEIPQLETLVLSSVPEQADLWKTWVLPRNITALPRLRSLIVDGDGMETDNAVQRFREFLEARADVKDRETLMSPFVPLELELRETAFPRWLIPRVERTVARVVYVQKPPEVYDY
ncbi:hypothetical protein EXIGLDRAFT_832563 [Exidia glandulosa HHB12029]|uniref:Uncharacterized protein n=1 Tax=Exidia glandulosa HHB12029 TaxID=1314781 RepID=A0A165LKE0_EXIGL|nr:hypothetical protein EXIGLDRAFT_832563 [Exidia glandulosa HHB12029]